MNKDIKLFLSILIAIFFAGAAVMYGAATAEPAKKPVTEQQPLTISKKQLEETLKNESPTISAVLVAAYPKITTDYTISKGQLFDQGQWYGTTLTYKGTDTMNRDTLRVLMQKKSGVWIMRTTPPELLLSAKKYPDVPKSVLKTINEPVSLPGTDSSPPITASE